MNIIKNVLIYGFFIFLMIINPLGAEEITVEEKNDLTQQNNLNDDSEDDFFDEEYLASLFYDAPDLIIEVPPFEPRSFDDVFPGMPLGFKNNIMNGIGLRYAFEKGGEPTFKPAESSGIDLLSEVLSKDPTHIIEALLVVPYNKRELDMLDIYNALSRIEKIKDHTLVSRSGKITAIFTDTTRLKSATNRKAVPDPSPSEKLPYAETMYLRFTDSFIGNLFLRGDMSLDLYGITYKLTNFRDINFAIFRIMKAEKVTISLYLEPIEEGILIYSASGMSLPGFIIKRMNLTPNINNRIRVLTEWIKEGLKEQENQDINEDREQSINAVIHNNRLNRINQMMRVD